MFSGPPWHLTCISDKIQWPQNPLRSALHAHTDRLATRTVAVTGTKLSAKGKSGARASSAAATARVKQERGRPKGALRPLHPHAPWKALQIWWTQPRTNQIWMSSILTLALKTGLLLSLRFLKILRGIRILHVMIKSSIQKEDITIINKYAILSG